MSRSYQNEIPKARVNITLDVDNGASQKKKELPMKTLMMGDYSQGKSIGPVAERERININKTNFNQVMQDLQPSVKLGVKNCLSREGDELQVDLVFKSMDDFKPANIANNVPALKRLLAMRNLLKDLKASVIDNNAFRKELEAILKNSAKSEQLMGELKKIAPID